MTELFQAPIESGTSWVSFALLDTKIVGLAITQLIELELQNPT